MSGGPSFLHFSFPGPALVKCAFGTRQGGMSSGDFYSNNVSLDVGDLREHVLANRRAAREKLGFTTLVELQQVHGSEIHFDLPGNFPAGSGITGDGAALSSPDSAVMIKTADCQPVFLAHESGRYICGLHVGWRGNLAGFPALAVSRFCGFYNISPSEVLAVRGPSLGPCCSEFKVFEENWTDDFFPYFHAQSRTMDLWSLTRDQLAGAGIPAEKMFSIDLCTKCMSELFFSYRREKKCGRQGSFILIQGGSP